MQSHSLGLNPQPDTQERGEERETTHFLCCPSPQVIKAECISAPQFLLFARSVLRSWMKEKGQHFEDPQNTQRNRPGEKALLGFVHLGNWQDEGGRQPFNSILDISWGRIQSG